MSAEHDRAIAIAAIPIILEHLENSGTTMYYSELADAVSAALGEQVNAHFSLGGPLGIVQDLCTGYGAPCLASLVVAKETGLPSSGFAEPYFADHPHVRDMPLDEIVAMELDKVRRYDDWNGFLASLGCKRCSALRPGNNLSSEAAKRYREYVMRKENIISTEVRRNAAARQACLEHYGMVCQICGFDSMEQYGIPGIIHVHHIRPASDIDGVRDISPIDDLVPLCPTCHMLVHSLERNPASYEAERVYKIDKARAIWESGKR